MDIAPVAPASPASAFAAGASLCEPMVDAGEVAKLIGVSRYTILEWCKEGRLPQPIRIGRVIRWNRSIIAEFISGRTVA